VSKYGTSSTATNKFRERRKDQKTKGDSYVAYVRHREEKKSGDKSRKERSKKGRKLGKGNGAGEWKNCPETMVPYQINRQLENGGREKGLNSERKKGVGRKKTINTHGKTFTGRKEKKNKIKSGRRLVVEATKEEKGNKRKESDLKTGEGSVVDKT